MKLICALAIGTTACASLQGSTSSGCSPVEPPRAALTPQSIDELTGTFRLTLVDTPSKTKGAATGTPVVLELQQPDSAQRAHALLRAIGHSPRTDLRLVGTFEGNGREPAEWDAGTLYVGCRDCLDASPTELRITAIGRAGFRGAWVNEQTGIGRLVSEDGKQLPNPAGYFCAERI